MSTVRLGFGDVGACVCVMKVKTRFSLIYITLEPRILHLHSFHARKPQSPRALGNVRARSKPEKANAKAERWDRLSMGLERIKAFGLDLRAYRYRAVVRKPLSPHSLIAAAAQIFRWQGWAIGHG